MEKGFRDKRWYVLIGLVLFIAITGQATGVIRPATLDEGNLNVNASNYWDALDSPLASWTQTNTTEEMQDATGAMASTGLTYDDAGNALTVDLGTSIETGEITDDTISEADLDMTDSASDEDILTYETGAGGSFEWHPPSELITAGDYIDWIGTTLDVVPPPIWSRDDYVNETGDTMTGNLNMDTANITDANSGSYIEFKPGGAVVVHLEMD